MCIVVSCLVCILLVVLCLWLLVFLCVLFLVVLCVLLLVVLCVFLVVLCVLLSFYVYLLYCVYIAVFALDAGLLARSQFSQGPATGHLDTGFFFVSLFLKANAKTVPNIPSCHYMLLM